MTAADDGYDALPPQLRGLVERAEPQSPRAWATRPIPALGGKTVVQVYADEGVEAAEAFVRKVIGKFG